MIKSIHDPNSIQDANPIDYLMGAKLNAYNKGRINYVKVSVTFCIKEPDFEGVVWLMPCVYNANP